MAFYQAGNFKTTRRSIQCLTAGKALSIARRASRAWLAVIWCFLLPKCLWSAMWRPLSRWRLRFSWDVYWCLLHTDSTSLRCLEYFLWRTLFTERSTYPHLSYVAVSPPFLRCPTGCKGSDYIQLLNREPLHSAHIHVDLSEEATINNQNGLNYVLGRNACFQVGQWLSE